MAKHSRGSGPTPGPDPFKPADPQAYGDLPDSVRKALDQFHGDASQLETALENRLGSYPEQERQRIRGLVLRCLGLIPPNQPADQ